MNLLRCPGRVRPVTRSVALRLSLCGDEGFLLENQLLSCKSAGASQSARRSGTTVARLPAPVELALAANKLTTFSHLLKLAQELHLGFREPRVLTGQQLALRANPPKGGGAKLPV